MKKLVTTVLAIAAVSVLAASAYAANIFSEPFNYANGNLVPNGSWVNHGASTVGVGIQVVNGRAAGTHDNGPDDNRTFAAQPTTSATYACFEVSIVPPAVAGTPKIVYFAHFKDNTTTNFPARLYIVPDGTSTTSFKFAISANSTTALISPVVWATPSSYNTRYQIVIKYNPVGGSATLWVDPVTELSTSVTHTNTNGANFSVLGFALRQSSSASTTGLTAGTQNWGFSIDNLGVGTTFGDACAQVTPVEGSSWGRIKTIYR